MLVAYQTVVGSLRKVISWVTGSLRYNTIYYPVMRSNGRKFVQRVTHT